MANLFRLSKKLNGKKWEVDSIDSLPVINRRKKQLTASYRGQRVEIKVEPAEEEDAKYRKPLTDGSWRGGDYQDNKHKIKAKIKRAKRKNG